MTLRIQKAHVATFREIRDAFLNKTKIPTLDAWKAKSDAEIWLNVVIQVVVVGRSSPAIKLKEDKAAVKIISYDNLARLRDDKCRAREINRVLRKIGARYASEDLAKCRKTKALVANFGALQATSPRGYIAGLAAINGSDAEHKRVRTIRRTLRFFRSKSARDFLSTQGLAQQCIALDTRIFNTFRDVGLPLPDGAKSSAKVYDAVEREILDGICQPLSLSGIQFDKMLYQNYDDIAAFLDRKRRRAAARVTR